MVQKQARMPKPQKALTPAAPVCQLVRASDGEHVQRFPTEDEIRLQAYYRWEAAGCPSGDGCEFWLEAERELIGLA